MHRIPGLLIQRNSFSTLASQTACLWFSNNLPLITFPDKNQNQQTKIIQQQIKQNTLLLHILWIVLKTFYVSWGEGREVERMCVCILGKLEKVEKSCDSHIEKALAMIWMFVFLKNSYDEIRTSKSFVLGDGVLGKSLSHECGTLINDISDL